jgi:hypothetical protein
LFTAPAATFLDILFKGIVTGNAMAGVENFPTKFDQLPHKSRPREARQVDGSTPEARKKRLSQCIECEIINYKLLLSLFGRYNKVLLLCRSRIEAVWIAPPDFLDSFLGCPIENPGTWSADENHWTPEPASGGHWIYSVTSSGTAFHLDDSDREKQLARLRTPRAVPGYSGQFRRPAHYNFSNQTTRHCLCPRKGGPEFREAAAELADRD